MNNCCHKEYCQKHFQKYGQRTCFNPLYSLDNICEYVTNKYGKNQVMQE